METKVFSGDVHGINLKFIDLSTSGTPACVFTELQRDDYGLEQIELTHDDIVLDVGSNIGMFAIYVKKKFGCKVVCFEPVPLNFEHLKENIKLNGLNLEDFELHNIAITAKDDDIIEIGTPGYNTGGSSIFHKCDIISQCKTKKLGKYINKNCTYLKIDTEGGEYEIVPDILDNLNNFSYIGIEYHRFTNTHNPLSLHTLLKSNFQGRIFYQDAYLDAFRGILD